MIRKRKEMLQKRLDRLLKHYDALWEAYDALVSGGVKSYMIGDRQLSRFDLDEIKNDLEDTELKIAETEALLGGRSVRKAVGVIPRDW